MSPRARIAVAGFQHETNTFAPFGATFTDFEKPDGWPGLTVGSDIIDVFTPLNIGMGGFLTAMPDAEIVPLAWCSAEPCSKVEDAAFDRISGLILEKLGQAGPVDGVYLDIHGAMVTESHEDGEGELLRRVRAFVGRDVPIVISLDLHANLTDAMVELADGITIYRTYPHIDMAETGAEAARLMRLLLGSKTRFHKALRRFPYLMPLHIQCTTIEPCQGLYNRLAELQTGPILRTDLAAGFPAADIREAGPAFIVQGTDAAATERAADQLLQAAVEAEGAFDTSLLSPLEAVRAAMRRGKPGRPVVLADVQDNPGAGGSSDTTELLRVLVSEGARDTALALMWDPKAALAAHAAGVGADLELDLGGKFMPGDRPFSSRFKVDALSSGSFTCSGVMYKGVTVELGPMAVLRITDGGADIRVVVNSTRFQCLDLDIFRHIGIEPTEMAILVIKSTVHFRADFEPIAGEILTVEAPGLLPCRLDTIPYRYLRSGVRLGPLGPLSR
jgi:microcystin degradation protein MlrC